MTVVPDDNLMTLICDVCGETTTGTACVLPDAEVVWTLVSDHGWSGSPFATGPHRCPRCSTLPPGPTAPGGDRAGGPRGMDRIGDVMVVATNGDLDADAGNALRTALRGAVDMGGTVVVDLARVQVIDPVGLGLLVRAHREVRDRGGRLCLAAPSRFIRTVLHTMKLDGVFPIYDDLDAALAELRAAARSDAPADAGSPAPLPTRRRPASSVTV
ncbi:anti-sigma factor antagonist [Micromonospora craterilacus]|uniref:Anti-sigma factor antagonist n=1 Tax=Micromonospora craterilacus TaxID=1655439 RepID=A0A2W2FHN4_9ACTN|nr:STAS domain-containing protein [Micromonospora craterilacus]PZG24168.1 anti-sigma factor antagonist [Micromonospora craterilacus]